MFTLTNLTKIYEGMYRADSLPCPRCQGVGTIEIEGRQVFMYHQGAPVQEVLYNFEPEDRERFMTGFCNKCWSIMMEDDYEQSDLNPLNWLSQDTEEDL